MIINNNKKQSVFPGFFYAKIKTRGGGGGGGVKTQECNTYEYREM